MARRRRQSSRVASSYSQVSSLRGVTPPQHNLTLDRLITDYNRQMRDAFSIARTGTPVRRSDYRDVEDLRRYNAESSALRPDVYRLVDGRRASYGYGVPPHHNYRPGWPQDRLRFYDPRTTVVCVRRYARRRIIFALRRAGRRGARRNRAARWSAKSYVQCK